MYADFWTKNREFKPRPVHGVMVARGRFEHPFCPFNVLNQHFQHGEFELGFESTRARQSNNNQLRRRQVLDKFQNDLRLVQRRLQRFPRALKVIN